MKKRISLTVIAIFCYFGATNYYEIVRGSIESNIAVHQLKDSINQYSISRNLATSDAIPDLIDYLSLFLLLLIWVSPIKKGLLVMKKTLFVGFFLLFIVACGSAKIEKFVEIKPHETAFLIPLEGATKAGQAKFMSVEYLEKAKVATKRISLPQRKHVTGRWDSIDYEWIPTVKVITVSRKPVTREWTADNTTGTSNENQAIFVESKDSIGFGVGVTITAMVTEESAAKFLYYYAGNPLDKIIDQNVRGKVNAILAREFAKYNLEEARKKKNDIFQVAAKEVINDFDLYGISITNIGLAEGMVYENVKIQQAIDDVFTAEMNIQVENQKLESERVKNKRILEVAINEKKSAKEFALAAEARKKQASVEIDIMLATAKLEWVKKWDGKLPQNILPENSSILMGLNK
jgi:hypothetical protein